MLRKWKKGQIERKEYNEKQRHDALCELKQKEKRERGQKRLREITNETEIWKYIKKERGRREKPDESIGKE